MSVDYPVGVEVRSGIETWSGINLAEASPERLYIAGVHYVVPVQVSGEQVRRVD